MKKISLILPVIMMLITASCEFDFSTANISDIKVCTSMSGNLCGNDNSTLSTSTQNIFVSCKLKNAPADTKVKFTWKYVEAEPLTIDEVVLNSEDRGTNLDLHSSLSRPYNGWPKGKYAVEIRIGENDDSPETKKFEIR